MKPKKNKSGKQPLKKRPRKLTHHNKDIPDFLDKEAVAPLVSAGDLLPTDEMKKLSIPQRRYLRAYAECGNRSEACRIAGVRAWTAWNWKKIYPEYEKVWKIAHMIAGDRLEEEARIRALQGMQKYKFNGRGQPIMIQDPRYPDDPTKTIHYSEWEKDTALLIRLLQAHFPKKYAKQQHIQKEVTGKTTVDVNVSKGQFDWSKVPIEDHKAYVELMDKLIASQQQQPPLQIEAKEVKSDNPN